MLGTDRSVQLRVRKSCQHVPSQAGGWPLASAEPAPKESSFPSGPSALVIGALMSACRNTVAALSAREDMESHTALLVRRLSEAEFTPYSEVVRQLCPVVLLLGPDFDAASGQVWGVRDVINCPQSCRQISFGGELEALERSFECSRHPARRPCPRDLLVIVSQNDGSRHGEVAAKLLESREPRFVIIPWLAVFRSRTHVGLSPGDAVPNDGQPLP